MHSTENQLDDLKPLRRTTLLAPDIRDGITGGTQFQELPAATTVAAGSDNLTVTTGTGTEVTGRDSKGRANFKSQATTPADNDNVLLVPANTTNILNQAVSATAEWRFNAQVTINTITALFFSIGPNENITDADPTGTAGDGAMFFFCPTGAASEMAVDPGLATAAYANWALAHKVAGADTFAATSIPVVAGREYFLQWVLGTDRKVRFYIDGTLVGIGPALTDAAALRFMAGLELTATPGGQKDFSVRGISVFRPS
jgi:hypothetical protein